MLVRLVHKETSIVGGSRFCASSGQFGIKVSAKLQQSSFVLSAFVQACGDRKSQTGIVVCQ
jgi:hypothetical protein